MSLAAPLQSLVLWLWMQVLMGQMLMCCVKYVLCVAICVHHMARHGRWGGLAQRTLH